MTEEPTPDGGDAPIEPPAAPPPAAPEPAAGLPPAAPEPAAGLPPAAPEPQLAAPAPLPGAPEPPVAPAAPPAKKPSRLRPLIVIGAIVVFIGVVLFATRNNTQANDLKVGDCFVIPDGTTITTVEQHPCTESHNAEVVFVGTYPDSTYPIDLSLRTYVGDNCVTASETYVGRSLDDDPELSIGYFAPTRDSWDAGDRSITCYVSLPDESMVTESFKSS